MCITALTLNVSLIMSPVERISSSRTTIRISSSHLPTTRKPLLNIPLTSVVLSRLLLIERPGNSVEILSLTNGPAPLRLTAWQMNTTSFKRGKIFALVNWMSTRTQQRVGASGVSDCNFLSFSDIAQDFFVSQLI